LEGADEYLVRVVPWEDGCELHIAPPVIGVTQCHDLAGAEGMVRSWLRLHGRPGAEVATVRLVRDVPASGPAEADEEESLGRFTEANAARLFSDLDEMDGGWHRTDDEPEKS
jgi:hypothetical protein